MVDKFIDPREPSKPGWFVRFSFLLVILFYVGVFWWMFDKLLSAANHALL